LGRKRKKGWGKEKLIPETHASRKYQQEKPNKNGGGKKRRGVGLHINIDFERKDERIKKERKRLTNKLREGEREDVERNFLKSSLKQRMVDQGGG